MVQFPVVDISTYATKKAEVSQELAKAASDIGFFYVTGHGISQERIDRAFATGKKWFAQSEEEKKQYTLDRTEYVGWKGEGVLNKNHSRPIIEQQVFGHPAADNPFANKTAALSKEVIPETEEFTTEFLDDLLRIGQTILRGLALALGQEEDFFVKGLRRDLPDIAGGGGWNHYLPYESTDKSTEWRIPAHADAELFTLLFQQEGQPGLEVTPGKRFFDVANKGEPFLKNYEQIQYPASDALEFYPMPPVKGAITVNIGDLLMRWSDGVYLSTYHRVRAPTKDNDIPLGERYTLVYFAQPARSTLIKSPKGKWPPIKAGDDTAQMAAKHFAKIKARWTTGRLDQFEEVKGPAYAKEPKINSSAQVSVTA